MQYPDQDLKVLKGVYLWIKHLEEVEQVGLSAPWYCTTIVLQLTMFKEKEKPFHKWAASREKVLSN